MVKKITLLVFVLVGTVSASPIELNSIDSGSYLRDGAAGSRTFRHSYNESLTRISSQGRAYYIFDLSTLSDTVLSAQLNLGSISQTNTPRLQAFDVVSDLSVLDRDTPAEGDTQNNAYRAFYRDLGRGTSFSTTQTGLNLNLNADALTAINSAGGLFAVGIRNRQNNSELIADGARLTLTTATPEASEILLILLGICFLVFYQKKISPRTA